MSEEDKVKREWGETKDEKGEVSGYKWDDEKGGEKECPFQEKTLEFVRNFIKEKNEKGEFTAQDRPIIQLSEKLK